MEAMKSLYTAAVLGLLALALILAYFVARKFIAKKFKGL
jgi:uncharacterized protein YneF (UPF0154 family)